jgi:hypothetical protein
MLVVSVTKTPIHSCIHGAHRMMLFDYPDSAMWRIRKKSCMGLRFLHFLLLFVIFTSYNIEKIGLNRFNSKISVSTVALCVSLPCSLATVLYPKSIPKSFSCVGVFRINKQISLAV